MLGLLIGNFLDENIMSISLLKTHVYANCVSARPTLTAELLVFVIGSLSAVGVAAQTVPTPGAIFESVRPPAGPIPTPQTQSPLARPPPVQQDLDPNAARTPVSEFRIVGNQAIDRATLDAVIAAQPRKPYNLFELNKVARLITDLYQARGYVVARAVIPAQKIESGVVTIEVIEGKIDQVAFSGNAVYSQALLARWGQPLVGQVVNLVPLEERMLLINDLPGMEARAVLTPGAVYGATKVDVSVQEKQVDGQVSVNNNGRREVGEDRVDASINVNNPFGIGDQLGVRASYSEHALIKMLGINYSVPLDVMGTRLAINYIRVKYRIGGDLSALDINGTSSLGGAAVSHPFLRSKDENLFGTVGARTFSGKQLTSDIPLTSNSIFVLEAGLSWNRIDSNANVSAAAVRISSNFKDSAQGTRTDAQKFKVDGEASELLRVSANWDLRLSGSAQWAPDTVSDAEKFSLGGPASVRGYPSADVRGDRGAFASVEARYRTELGGVPAYVSVFADGGHVFRINPGPGNPRSDSIGSAGVGFTFFPSKSIMIETMAAAPTGKLDPSDAHHNGRLWFNLTKTF